MGLLDSISLLTVFWSVCFGVCLMLGLVHLGMYLRERRRLSNLLFAVFALGAAWVVAMELVLQRTESLEVYRRVDLWMPVALAVVLVAMVWLINAHEGFGRRWLASSSPACGRAAS